MNANRIVILAAAALLCAPLACTKKDDEAAAEKALRDKARVLKEKARVVRKKAREERKKAREAKAKNKPAKPFHPDYPTPQLAESEAIFLLEEPERGPVVTKAPKVNLTGLKWSTHAYCHVGADAMVCGPAGKGAAAAARWRLGRRGKRVAVAEERFGPRMIGTVHFEYAAGGKIRRMVRVSDLGVVEWSRHFDSQAKEFSARLLNGANGLAGCGRMAVKRDRQGRVTAITCMQWTVGAMKDKQGVEQTRQVRDRHGLIRRSTRHDAGGKAVAGHDGYHRVDNTRDRAGRVLIKKYLDAQGLAAMDAWRGCYGWKYQYNERGLLEKEVCLGANGEPILGSDGVCGRGRKYDGRGCQIQVLNLVLSSGACARPSKRFDYEVDARCGRLRRTCYLVSGKRTGCGTRQAAEFRYTRDEKGRVISTRHFKADRQPGKDTSCDAFETRSSYDEVGNEVTRSWFKAGGLAQDCSRTGFHKYRNTYDHAGRLSERRFFDPAGAATTNLGCAVRKYIFDNYDHQVEAEDRDAAGALVAGQGMARKRTIYDAGHRQFGMLLFDIKGEPANYGGCFTGQKCTSKKWHALRIMRRPNGAVAENAYFDREGQLIDTINCDKNLCWE